MVENLNEIDLLSRARDELLQTLPSAIAAIVDDPCILTAHIPDPYRETAHALHGINRKLINAVS